MTPKQIVEAAMPEWTVLTVEKVQENIYMMEMKNQQGTKKTMLISEKNLSLLARATPPP